ncbi:hypothetical protein TrVE_jg11008 [Triparma verrucosa]|uniref:Uncharacterized protein n=1 Tax=Triparma verrucosa TaxID=1606542 RepID=A0A9W7BYI6_9STRA|nr:hypothetical protein TrVE_jg11008 [Triparma verrucosa]
MSSPNSPQRLDFEGLAGVEGGAETPTSSIGDEFDSIGISPYSLPPTPPKALKGGGEGEGEGSDAGVEKSGGEPPLNRELIVNNLKLLVNNLNTLKHDLQLRTTQNAELRRGMAELEKENTYLKAQNRTLHSDLKSMTKEVRLQKISSSAPHPSSTPLTHAPEVTEVLSMLRTTRTKMCNVFTPDAHPETDRLASLRAAGFRTSMSPTSPSKGDVTVQDLADDFDGDRDYFKESLRELSPKKVMEVGLIEEVEQRALGFGDMEVKGAGEEKEEEEEEKGVINVIKSCEKRVGELRVNRIVENLFHDSPPQSYKGNPFDDLDDMNPSEDDDVENRDLNDLDSLYLVMK